MNTPSTIENERKTISKADWLAEGERLFGADKKEWKFKCPQCGGVQTASLFRKHNIDPNGVLTFSCIGRWVKGLGCDWSLGGLFQIHKLEVIDEEGTAHPVFEFAEEVAPKKN